MNEYRLCVRCDTRPRREKDSYCASCRAEVNHELLVRRKDSGIPKHVPGELSTRAALAALWRQGIPACPGSVVGQTWIDLVAWGCVPVEAKMSHPSPDSPNKYKWTFTTMERQRVFSGVFLFIARTPNGDRHFIVPCNSNQVTVYGKPFRTALSVTFDTDHFNATIAEWLLTFEDRWDYIESERLNYSSQMAAVEPLDYSLWRGK